MEEIQDDQTKPITDRLTDLSSELTSISMELTALTMKLRNLEWEMNQEATHTKINMVASIFLFLIIMFIS